MVKTSKKGIYGFFFQNKLNFQFFKEFSPLKPLWKHLFSNTNFIFWEIVLKRVRKGSYLYKCYLGRSEWQSIWYLYK